MAHSQEVKKLLDHLQSDLKNISLEAKRRHPGVKESAEEAIVKESICMHHVVSFVAVLRIRIRDPVLFYPPDPGSDLFLYKGY
jgi:hypothetical protein